MVQWKSNWNMCLYLTCWRLIALFCLLLICSMASSNFSNIRCTIWSSVPFFHLLFIIVIDFLVQILYFHFDFLFHCSDLLFLNVSRVPGCVVVRHPVFVEAVFSWGPCHICVLIFLITDWTLYLYKISSFSNVKYAKAPLLPSTMVQKPQ